jgi:transcription initiation factor TFIIIB Brf1 subunit/transcription initiation factor TFIIB
MRGDIAACQRCGSDDLRMVGIRDGAFVGTGDELSRVACNRCGLAAVPLLFDSEAARKAFESEQAKHPSKDWPASGWPSTRFRE